MIFRSTLVAIVVALCGLTDAVAQTSARTVVVAGTVQDQTGAALQLSLRFRT